MVLQSQWQFRTRMRRRSLRQMILVFFFRSCRYIPVISGVKMKPKYIETKKAINLERAGTVIRYAHLATRTHTPNKHIKLKTFGKKTKQPQRTHDRNGEPTEPRGHARQTYESQAEMITVTLRIHTRAHADIRTDTERTRG